MELCDSRSSILLGKPRNRPTAIFDPAPEQVTRFFVSHGITPSHLLATTISPNQDLEALWKSRTRDAPRLVNCTMFVRELAPRSTPVVLVLTSATRVSHVVKQLRSYHRMLLISSFGEDSWMADALDILVVQPEDAYYKELFSRISAVVVDEDDSLDDASLTKALDYLRRNCDFSAPTGPSTRLFPPHRNTWLTAFQRLNEELLAALSASFPEAISQPGLGDKIFLSSVRAFSDGLVNVRVQDWPGVVALIPGLFRGLTTSLNSIVLVPPARVAGVVKLLRFFAQYMGLVDVCVSGFLDLEPTRLKAHVLVCTPDLLVDDNMTSKAKRVVIVEADVLLQLGFRQQIEAVVKSIAHAQPHLAVHSSGRCEQADVLVRQFSEHQVKYFPPGQPTLASAKVFLEAVADETEKLDRVYDVWHDLKQKLRSHMKLSVLCNSREKVAEVAEELRKRGVSGVMEIHSGMSEAETLEAKLAFDRNLLQTVVVTNVLLDEGGADLTDAVVVEVPDDADEYARRAGVNRMKRSRLVINIVCHGEEEQQLKRFCEYHGVEAAPFPTKLCRLFELRNQIE